MKIKAIAVAAMMAVCGLAAASENDTVDAVATRDSMCETTAGLAASIMKARQAGLSLTDALAVSGRTQNKAVSELNTSLVMIAWNKTRYHSDQMQRRAVEDFRDETHISCLNSRGI